MTSLALKKPFDAIDRMAGGLEKLCLLVHVLVNDVLISTRTGANALRHKLVCTKKVSWSAFGPRMIFLVLERLDPQGV